MTTTKQQHRQSEEFPLFDWLRFILASVVALGHEGVITWAPAGNFAVQIFFALSGWLIGGILFGTSFSDLPRFFYNRATRIWIPYFFAVALIYSFSALRDPLDDSYFYFLFYDLTFTHNWFIQKIPAVISVMPLEGTGAHFWSISVEEQFYLTAPLLILATPFGRSKFFWFVLSVAATASQSWYGSISLGVLAAAVRAHHGDWQFGRLGFLSVLGTIAALTTLILAAPQSYSLVVPLLAISIVLIASLQGKRGSIGRFAGGISYPLYLYHWIGMFAANYMSKRLGIALPSIGWTAYLVALMVGSLAYLVVDRNIMRFRDTLYRPALARLLMATAYLLLMAGAVGGVLNDFGV